MSDPLQRLTRLIKGMQCTINHVLERDAMENSERRVHGFAEGDRVAVVDGDYKGAYGKLIYVGGGWCNAASEGRRHCRETCIIFCLDIQGGPHGTPGCDGERWLPAAKLTHVD